MKEKYFCSVSEEADRPSDLSDLPPLFSFLFSFSSPNRPLPASQAVKHEGGEGC